MCRKDTCGKGCKKAQIRHHYHCVCGKIVGRNGSIKTHLARAHQSYMVSCHHKNLMSIVVALTNCAISRVSHTKLQMDNCFTYTNHWTTAWSKDLDPTRFMYNLANEKMNKERMKLNICCRDICSKMLAKRIHVSSK